ncbi:MAG: AI-2E family transporter [Frankiaceae bacterium]
MQTQHERVPVRTIATTIAMVLLTALAVYLLVLLHRAVTWLVVAAFLAVLANAVVAVVERRFHLSRGIATGVVFVLGTILVVGLAALFVRPIAREVNQFADDLPRYVEQARSGRGPVGELITRFKLDERIAQNQAKLQESLSGLGKPALAVAQGIANTLVGALVVLVLTIFMTLEGPALVRGALGALPAERRERVAKVASDCGRAVTGYMTGQLFIAALCGISTYLVLLVLGVPFRGTVALFVAIADLIPLVGATIGAVVAVAVALLSSTTDGIVVAVWFLIYQQLENHLLQPLVQSRTVKLNPLTVLVSVILGVELVGILGALLAIPVAGMISVIVRDVWDHRRGRPKAEPTTGTDSQPVDGRSLPTAQPQL